MRICAQVYALHTRWEDGTPIATCQRCGQPIDMRLRWPNRNARTVGHRISIHDGGHPTDLNNLGPEHLRCNSGAGSRPVTIRTSVEW